MAFNGFLLSTEFILLLFECSKTVRVRDWFMNHQFVAETSLICLLDNRFNLNCIEVTLDEDKCNDHQDEQSR